MDTEITPTQLAIEYFSSNELKEEIYFAWRLGVHVH